MNDDISAETIVYLATMQKALDALDNHDYHAAIKHSYEATILLKNPLVRREMELVWGDAKDKARDALKSDTGYTDLSGEIDTSEVQSDPLFVDLSGDDDVMAIQFDADNTTGGK